MDHRIHQVPQHQALQLLPAQQRHKNTGQSTADFQSILSKEQELKVSKHAIERLSERNIKLNDKQWQAISEKMQEARQKGVTDSLVVTDQATLVVNAKNNTVVTAMAREEATSRIFTNINGTILIND